MRRSLAGALWLIAGLLASFLGAVSALVDTASGRTLLARVATDAARGVFDGFVQVGDVRGPLLTGVTLRNVTILDPDSTLVASLRKVEASYNPLDFAAGRVVLLELDLTSPVFNVVQHKGGRLNVEEFLRLGLPSKGPKGPGKLILFRNVRVSDGTVNMRLQTSGEQAGHEVDPLEFDGRRRIRRFEHVDLRLAALRISSPREPGVRLDITHLAMISTDPDVELRDARGRITIVGDSLEADLQRLDLPASRIAGRGTIRWPRDTLLYDLTLKADSAALGDLGFLSLPFPDAAQVRGGVRVRSHGSRRLEVELNPLDARYGGGTLTGRITTFTVADSGLVAVRGADLMARDANLDLVRGVVTNLPFYGRLSGHTTADGPMGDMAVEVDWVFRDSLVPNWPQSRVRGQGSMDLSGEDVRFVSFAVHDAAVDLGTVRQLVPAVVLRGEVAGSGGVTGPLHNALFTGTLVHRDGARPPSTVTGAMRLDTRGDTVGVYADVRADSLSFDGLRGSYPDLALRGSVAGPIRLNGSVAALETHADLQSAAGAVTVDGVVTLLDTRTGVRNLALAARNVNLARWTANGPQSRVSFFVDGSIAQDSGAAPTGALTAGLAPSLVAGTPFDTGQVSVRFAGGSMVVDSVRLAQQGLHTEGSGSLGWRRPDRGAMSLTFDADSLNALDSLVAWIAGPDVATTLHGRPLRGAARVLLTLTGALDSLAIDASVSAANVHWRDWEVTEGLAHVAYQPGPVPVFDAQATADSARLGEYALGGVSARVAGRRDSLTWFARSRVGDLVAFVAGGRYSQHSPLAVGLDSLAVLLPGGVWILQAPAVLTLTDSTAQFSGATLASVEGTGRVAFQPMRTARKQADAHGEVQGFPLAAVYALAQHDTSGVSGAVSGTISITGSREAPVYEGSIALANAALGEFRAPRVDGTFGYRDRRLDAALRLWRDQQAILTVKARLPLDLALQPVAKRQVSDTLAVTARADSVDLSVLEALTPLVRQVQGVFSADVGVAGTWDDPRLHGTVRIGGAAATFPDLNVRYTDMAGRLRLSGDTIGVESLSARSDKGTLSVAGYVRLEELTRPVLALRFAADRFKALDLKGNVTVTASGRLALNGPVFGATLTGQATVTSGVLYFADLIEKRIVNLEELADTTLLSIIERQGLRPQFQSVFLDSLHIRDLQLGMGNEVWLRSNEANIQLQGSVAMSKQRATYLVSGTLQAPRGTYRLKIGPVTREFSVTQGTVRYFGTPDLDAELNIEARHTVHPVQTTSTARGCVPPNEDVVVIAHITGTLLVPKVSLEAEGKDCGQAEVISYVMFGKSSFELTGSQGAGGVYDQRALLQTAASVLSGELERTIVSDLGVPLDYLEIRPGAQQGPLQGLQLAVGRQVGRKTFLIANAGFCQGQAVAVNNTFGLTLKFRISPELRTEASYQPVQDCTTNTGAALQNVNRQFGVDLIWERWY